MQNANLWHSISYSLVIHYSVHSVFNVYAINTLFITFVNHKSRMFFLNFISSGLLEKFQPLASYFQNWRLFFVHDKYSSSPSWLAHTHTIVKQGYFLCLISGWTLKQCKKRRTITLIQIMLKHTNTYSYIP